jgi:hypothetical protein
LRVGRRYDDTKWFLPFHTTDWHDTGSNIFNEHMWIELLKIIRMASKDRIVLGCQAYIVMD